MSDGADQIRKMILEAMNALILGGKVAPGVPEDYVILSRWERIYDCAGVFVVRATLPKKLEPGNHVFVLQRSDTPDLVPVEVRHDRGATLWVRALDGSVEFLVERGDAKPTAIPLHPKLVHKSRLANYIGREQAQRFWDDVIRCRVVDA